MTVDLGVAVAHDGPTAVVALSGEIDYGNVAKLRNVFMDLAGSAANEITIDLGEVTFLDSTVLSVLVQGKQRLEESGRRMRVLNPQPRIERVLDLAGVLDYLRAWPVPRRGGSAFDLVGDL